MRSRLGWRVAVVAVVLGTASAVGLLPADGVQTAEFGLAATGARSKIVHSATGSPVHDSVLVYNRTARSLTISLDVVGVTQKADGSYSLGASGTGLAAHIRLQSRSVTLAARGRQTVSLTIDTPDHLSSPEYAAVTAIAGPASSTGVAVTERLAVLVGVTPPGAGSAAAHTSGASHKRTVAVVVATILLLALLAVLISAFVLRRRRSTPAAG
ncbi:MAG TPA: hypothetical protein VFH66_09840 [Mycobacteriales bacterium]|nr:hypothetical protein [Mycobacteriales bacterium]